MREMLKPPALKPGDTVAAVSLSWGGPGTHPHRYEAGKRQLEEEFNLSVVEMPNALRDPKWLYDNPKARAADLMEAFSNPDIKGIISTIGGDDSIRSIEHIDHQLIANNPKVFIGFSDTTVAHLSCFRAGLVSFYGPSMMTGFAENGGMHDYAVKSLRRILFEPGAPGAIPENVHGWTSEHIDWSDPAKQSTPRTLNPSNGWNWLQGSGRATGHLFGGCVEVLEWLRGTAVWPSKEQLDGAILFLETSEDALPPLAITQIVRALGASGIFNHAAGILIGRPGGPPEKISPDDFVRYEKAFMSVIVRELGRTDIPIVANMDFGHTDPVFTLPYGVQAEIDCDRRTVSILEGGVS